MGREEIIRTIQRRAQASDSAMLRVLSFAEIAWLVEPLLAEVPAALKSAVA